MTQSTVVKRRYLSTIDLLTMAAIAVVSAVLDSFAYPALMNVATPVFGFLGPVGWIAVSGVYIILPVVFGLLVARLGATTIYGIVQGFVEMLFGNAFGAMAMVYAALECFGVDVGLGIFRYRSTWLSAMVGGGLGTLLVDELYIFLFGMQSGYTITVGGITAFISGAIFGFVGWLIGQALYRTGVVSRVGLKGYEEIK